MFGTAIEKAVKTIGKNLDRQVAKESYEKRKKRRTLLNIVTTTSPCRKA
jgi:3-hydroxyacyl-CoA dehydrogenase